MHRIKVPNAMSRRAFKRRVALVLQHNLPSSNVGNSSHAHLENTISHNFASDTDWPWSDSESDIEDDPVRTWRGELHDWALRNKVNHTTINDLLRILQSFNIRGIPKDARTLLNTPKKTVVSEISGGTYWHNGIKKNLLLLYEGDKNKPKDIELMVNIDGLPISRSSNSQFWPIIGQVHKSDFDPFFIGIFHGYSKPKDVNEFLRPFVVELNDLLKNGVVIDDVHINVLFRCFLCDAPAKCLVKCIAYHNPYFACNFCCVEGQFEENRMSYPEFDCQLRTNESFRNRDQEEHHNSTSIVEDLPVDMIKCFPNDYLHLILLGITKTQLKTWCLGNNYETKLSSDQIISINNSLARIETTQPSEFARKIRSVNFFKKWKGTELRTWLLYAGPVVLRDILPPAAYNHFLSLHCAVRICTSSLVDTHLLVADKLFKFFAEENIELYGEQSATYNFHNISHVAEDVRTYGRLDSFSCFASESKLFYLKNLLRKGDKPLAQAINRLAEMDQLNPKKRNVIKLLFKNEMKDEIGSYEKLIYNNMSFDRSERNKWFLTESKEIVEFEKAFYLEGKPVVSGSRIKRKNDFFQTPLQSSFLDIYASSGLKDTPQIFEVTSIKTKIFAMNAECGIMYDLIEFVEDDHRQIFCSADNWTVNGTLYWPDNKKKVNQYRKAKKTPEISWQTFPPGSFKVLKKGIPTYKEALALEKDYEEHSDSESINEAKKRRARKRKNPVNSRESPDSFQLNALFQSISAKEVPDMVPNKKVKVNSSSYPIQTGTNDSVLMPGPSQKSDPNIFSIGMVNSPPSLNPIQDLTNEEFSLPLTNDLNDTVSDLPIITIEDLSEYLLFNGSQALAAETEFLGSLDTNESNTYNEVLQLSQADKDLSLNKNQTIPNVNLAQGSQDGHTHETNVLSDISSEVLEIRQTYEASSNTQPQMIELKNKLDNVEKKLAHVENKLSSIEAKQDTSKSQIDTLLKMVAAVHVKLDSLGSTTKKSAAAKSKTGPNVIIPVKLPLATDDGLRDLLLAFKNTIGVEDRLFDEMILIGGKDADACTKGVLEALFDDDILMKYTWNGTTDKAPIKDLKIHDFIKRCVRFHHEEYTDDNYKKYVQYHLKFAENRVSRRYL